MRTLHRIVLVGVVGVLLLVGVGCDRTDTVRSGCLERPSVRVVSGARTTAFHTDSRFPTDGTLDARTATWTTVESYPIHLDPLSGAGICVVGGDITGTLDHETTDWSDFKRKTGVLARSARPLIVGTRIRNVGDGVRIGTGVDGWKVQGVHVSRAHDDCVENDGMGNGVIDESLFDGCYGFLSGTDDEVGIPVDGTGRAVTITDSLIRLEPMPQVYRGAVPGHGPLWKLGSGPSEGDTGVAPRLGLTGVVIRIDQVPSHGSLAIPTYDDDGDPDTPRVSYLDPARCAGNTIVWLGGDPARHGADMPGADTYPASCFTFTADVGVWDAAVADWHAAHG